MPVATNRDFASGISSGSGRNDVAERLRQVTVEIWSRDGRRGSGVIWSEDGFIITNAHVAGGHDMVRLHDGRELTAMPIARSFRRDLAVLRIGARGLPRAERRDSRSLRPGEIVLAFGFPAGGPGAVRVGIAHSVPSGPWMEADIRLAPGNSGGPLADAKGNVVGINAMIANGMGIAVTTPAVEEFLAQAAILREGIA